MKIVRRFSTLFTTLVIAGVITIPNLAVAIDWPLEFDLLTPKDAADIERRDFSDDGKLQFDFSVKRSYPRFALDQEQYAKLHKKGWTECKTKRDEWFHFFDASAQAIPDKRCRYSFSKNFIKDTHLLFVIQRRYSKHEGVKNCPATPDNNDIDVTVLYQKYETPKQLRNALRIMELSCDQKR